MIEYIINNKEWLFSGIGVSLFPLSYFLIKKFFIQKDNKSITDAYKSNEIDSSPPNQSPLPGALKTEAYLIFEEIENAPLLQQDSLKKAYVGQKINWVAELSSIYKKGDNKVKVHLLCKKRRCRPVSLDCIVSLSDYPELAVMKKDNTIRVTGEITEVGPYSFELKNVQLYY